MSETKRLKASPWSICKEYAVQSKKYAYVFFFIVLGSTGIEAANLASPWFLRRLFNTLAGGHPSPEMLPALTHIILTIGAISLAGWTMRRIQSRALMYIEMHVMRDLSVRAFSYLLDHSHSFFTSNFSGSLTHKVSKYARAYEGLLDALLMELYPTTLFVVGAVVILYLQHPILGISLALWTICFVGFQIFAANKRQPLRSARAALDTKMTGTIADAISNQNTIALFAGEEHERHMLQKTAEEWRVATQKSWYADDRIWSVTGLFMVGVNVGLLWVAARYWSLGYITIGDIVLLQTYLLSTINNLLGINRLFRRLYDTFADAGEMISILEQPHEVTDIPGAAKLQAPQGAITIEHLSFSFTKDRPILADLSIAIPAKQKLALVGPSGAGKSTITKLLLRLYDIQDGTIRIDGQDIAQVTQESLRGAIAFVPQEPVLFHRTLMENIRYGKLTASDEEVYAAAKKAHCDEFISKLPEGYSTFVGERGVKLSGGERQRVAIARAILKNAPILILDEATSSLDSESEALIQDALDVLMQDKTVLVIAHRLSTIMQMDRIVVIEQGAVVADGTHDALLAKEGLYKKLWSIQAGGFIKDTTE